MLLSCGESRTIFVPLPLLVLRNQFAVVAALLEKMF
jgi:hypothetical protein